MDCHSLWSFQPGRLALPLRGGPTVLDRLIQQAIAQILNPYIDPTFSEHSHGFRPGRSAHDAVREVQGYIREGYKYAVDADLSKFFARVNHDIQMARISRHIRDKRVLRLIGLYLRAGIQDEHGTVPSTEGVPQGGPLSPLLANIVLDDLDRELEKRGQPHSGALNRAFGTSPVMPTTSSYW